MSPGAVDNNKMLLIFLSVLIITAVTFGWGSLFIPGRTSGDSLHGINLADLGFVGLFALTFVGSLANFLIPLSEWFIVAVALGGLTLLAFRHAVVRGVLGQYPLTVLIGLVVFAFVFSVFAHIREPHADTELYHLPAITWLHASNTPLGIANIVGQLGFNSTWFVTAAMFWLPGLGLTTVFSVNAVVLTILCTGLFQIAFTRRGGTAEPAALFGVVGLAFLFTGGISFLKVIGSPNTDIPAATLTIYVFYLALRLAEIEPTSMAYRWRLSLLTMVAVFSVAIKLSQLPVVCLPAYFWLRQVRKDGIVIRAGTWGLWLTTGFAVVWILRGLFSSGCLLFPQPFSCIASIPWAVSDSMPAEAQWGVRAYGLYEMASGPKLGYSEWHWVGPWWERFSSHHFVRGIAAFNVIVALFFIAGATLRAFHARLAQTPPIAAALRANEASLVKIWCRRTFTLFVFSLACLAYWFLFAPDIRFAYGFLAVASVLVTLLASSIVTANTRLLFARVLKATVGLALFILAVRMINEIDTSALVARWPVIEAKAVPRATCPDFLGFWPMYKCIIGSTSLSEPQN